MLNRTRIKELTYSSTYAKGMELYQDNKVLDFTVDDEDDEVEYIDALVQGSGRKQYDVSLAYSTEYDDLEEAGCNCAAFQNYEGLCKHCIAVLLEYADHVSRQKAITLYEEQQDERLAALQGLKGMKAKQSLAKLAQMPKTTPSIKALLVKQQMSSTLPILLRDEYGKVRLEPILTLSSSNGFEVEFKIGSSHMYVLKDVFAFISTLENKAEYAYGQKLKFVHTMEMFDPESRPLVDFLTNWVRENYDRYRSMSYYGYSYGDSATKLRHVPLGLGDLDSFLDGMGDRPFSASVVGCPEKTWQLTREPLPRTLLVTGKDGGVELKIGYLIGFCCIRYYNYFHEGQIYRVPAEELEPLKDFMNCMGSIPDRRVFIQKEDAPAFCRELLPLLKRYYVCTKENFDENEFGIVPAVFEIYLDAPQKDAVTCKPMAVYGDKSYPVYGMTTTDIGMRDMAKEAEIGKMVASYCNAYDEQGHMMAAAGDDAKMYELLVYGIPQLQQLGEVFISDALKRIRVAEAPKIAVGVSLSGDLLELSMTAGEMSRDQLLEILSKYNRKKKFYRLKNGDFVNLDGDDIQAVMELKQGLHLTDAQLKQETMVLPKYRALYLDGELKEWQALAATKDKAFKALIRNMKTVDDNDFEIPNELERILREYQKRGFLWIKTLQHNGFGGILADDMGLGKTLQVITFLESEHREAGADENRRCLVASPASLVFNWSSELQKFAPDLPVKMVVGTAEERRSMIRQSGNHDILLTSYDLLKRDIEAYEEITFFCQIIDEAQYIKNHSTQAAKAVKAVKAGFKLALTGTPVENRLSELWSIFDYLMPGFLYSYQRFREDFEIPIIQNQEEAAMKRLQKMIRPFVLRRLKKDVLTDLPDKIEKNLYGKMAGEQQKLYDAHVKRMQLMLDKQSDEEFKTSKIQILAELTKLRQICCNPALIYEHYSGESVKMDLCLDLMSNAISSGHKILLFSQFTSMLEQLQERMKAEGISFYTLTGATSKEKRAGMVEAFNRDETSVFCISLKAGGTGLNLTGADIVIHFDPWWNFAVQNQATDRAHRIGQKNVVTVYKLIVKGTVEENIMRLQEKKRELADQILSGEGMDSGSFNKEELLELLQ